MSIPKHLQHPTRQSERVGLRFDPEKAQRGAEASARAKREAAQRRRQERDEAHNDEERQMQQDRKGAER